MSALRIGFVGRLFGGVELFMRGFDSGLARELTHLCIMPRDIPRYADHCEGWVLFHFDSLPQLPALMKPGRPVVGRSLEYLEHGIPSILMGDERVGQVAAEHLLPRCRGELIYLGMEATFARRRQNGFVEACAAAGRTARALLLDGTDLDGLVRTLPAGSGVFCVHDGGARRVIAAAGRAGRSIPGEIAIVGVDNSPTPAGGPAMGLTTIELPLEEQGRRIGQAMADLLAGRTVPARQVVESVRLIERESSVAGLR